MAAIMLEAPRDEIGVPLPILQTNLPPGADQEWNKHHGFYDRKKFMSGPEANRAVRISRLQYCPKFLHDRFHSAFKDGVPLPENDYEAFKLTVLCYAGYLPNRAVDVSRSEPKTVDLSRTQRRKLRMPGVLVTELKEEVTFKTQLVGNFLIKYCLDNGLNEVKREEDLIGSFLETDNAETKLQKGLQLIGMAAEVASEPFEIVYNAARKQRALRREAPSCPRRLVKTFVQTRVPDYMELLEINLQELVA